MDQQPEPDRPPPVDRVAVDRITVSHILVAAFALVGMFMAAQLAARLSNLWMLIFGAVLVAVILRSIADPLARRTRISDPMATLVAVLVVVLVVGAIASFFGRAISLQLSILLEQLPAAWEVVRARVEASPLGDELLQAAGTIAGQAAQALLFAQRFATSALSGITTMVLVLVAGIFLAMHPGVSRDGVLALAPLSVRPRLTEVMDACGRALKGWLKAQMISMLLVGTLISIGLAIIGLPSPVAFGLITGLAQFVPVVGPIVSAVPALLVAATVDATTLGLTLLVYIVVSQLEANLITPLVQRNVASLPVVLGIFAVVGFGVLFGPLGVLFATPLTLVLYTVVTMLYRQDVLKDPEARAPGQRS